MIYHVTYISDQYKVKGYLSLPNAYDLPAAALQDLLHRCYGDVALPIQPISSSIQQGRQDIRSVRLPGLIYCRGGIGKVGRVQTHWIEQFADCGAVVFAPSYRGNEGGEGSDQFGGADREDVFSAYRFMQSLPFVQTDRISVMGFSRGAINATQTSIACKDVHKLILWGGVSDVAQTYEERVDLRRMLKRVLGGTPAKKPEAYRERSPLFLADRITCPVLIIHGTEDQQVDYNHGRNMYNRLIALQATVDMHSYEGFGHHLPASLHQTAVKRMFDWMI